MNVACAVGRLTRDPNLIYTPTGVAICFLTVAVNRPFVNGQGEKEADFLPVKLWRKAAENTAEYCRKGRRVSVSGPIRTRLKTVTLENGQPFTYTESWMEPDFIEFLDDPNGSRRVYNNEDRPAGTDDMP